MLSTTSFESMHIYLRLAIESGNPVVEQLLEVGFLSGSWLSFLWFSKVTDNPNTKGKPWSIDHFLVLYKCYSHKSYASCI